MASRPVKVLPDLQTQKQIIKIDAFSNLLFNVSGSLGDGHVSSSLPITASNAFFKNVRTATDTEFTKLNIITSPIDVYSTYDVNEAFHAIDDIINESSATVNAYKRLRFQQVDFFDSNGHADIILPLEQYEGPAFPIESFDYINVSVMVKENNSWYNDIVSVNLTIIDDQIHIIIDAPALNDSNQYKLLATNENVNDYNVV